MKMSKTAALVTARRLVTAPVGRGTSWQVYGPYSLSVDNGPSTSTPASSYQDALRKRREWVAELALARMGYDMADAGYAIHRATLDRRDQTVGELFEAALDALAAQ